MSIPLNSNKSVISQLMEREGKAFGMSPSNFGQEESDRHMRGQRIHPEGASAPAGGKRIITQMMERERRAYSSCLSGENHRRNPAKRIAETRAKRGWITLLSALAVLNLFFLVPHFRAVGYDQEAMKKMTDRLRQEIRGMISAELGNYADDETLSVYKEGYLGSILSDRSVQVLTDEELDGYTAGSSGSQTAGVPGLAGRVGGSKDGGGFSEAGETRGREIPGLEASDGLQSDKDHALERTLIEEGGLLLRKGTLQIVPSFTVAHYSSNRINIEGFSILPVLVIGEISTEAVKRDMFISALSLKYGLWRNLQAEVKVPYRYEYDRIANNIGEEKTDGTGGLGDIDASLSYQISKSRGWLPDMIASVGVKSRTGQDAYKYPIGLGTGHWGIKAGLVAVKTSDPAVVFGNVNYTWNIARQIEEYGLTVDPGDSVGYGVGTAIALSYQTALSFQLEHSITKKMKYDGYDVNGSFVNAASFKTGFTWTCSEKAAVDVGVTFGLTTDAPDYVFELRFPYTF